ncbi:Multidrug export protein MepA [Blautia producta]|uniref:Multidrug export protein MepA n=1 Tax=Blautia producta TaxID=33035 RepID=A0A4V0Z7H0_9FIRM|nr:MATE family efflux transporter [Blautia producta]QBE96768.1 Multidrug export protein MepA [Blautia producta]
MSEHLTIYQKPVTFWNMLKFTFPTMVMALIQVLYTTVDGIFVARFVGTDAMAALTLLSPYFSLLFAISTMLSSGGSAIVMRKMGERKENEAKQDFTALILLNFFLGILFTVIGILFSEPLTNVFGASPQVTLYCKEYLFYYVLFAIPTLLMSNLQVYVVAANSPVLAFGVSLSAGLVNVGLDYLFVAVAGWGVKGTAVATGFSSLIPTIICIVYFMKKSRLLHFVKPLFRIRTLIDSATNGMSEMATTLVSGITALFMNGALLRYSGENGVAAYTIIYYVFSAMTALYIGYIYGAAPVISYNYGQRDTIKLKKLTKVNLIFIALVSGISALSTWAFGGNLIGIFAGMGTAVYEIAAHGNFIFTFALLFNGFNTYASGMFTALSNGIVSGVIAFCRTFLFSLGAILLLPEILQINGVWLATPAAEFLGIIVSLICFFRYKKRYGY